MIDPEIVWRCLQIDQDPHKYVGVIAHLERDDGFVGWLRIESEALPFVVGGRYRINVEEVPA